MQNGVTHVSYNFWNQPYSSPSYLGTPDDCVNYRITASKVNLENYLIREPNPKKDAMEAEDKEMAKKFDWHCASGAAFKDEYGQFNYSLIHSDGLLKFSRDATGELVPLEVRYHNRDDDVDKITLCG